MEVRGIKIFSHNTFRAALLISLIIHGAILFQNANLNLSNLHRQTQGPDLIYVKIPQENKIAQKVKLSDKEPFLKLPQKITMDKKIPPPFMDKENIFKEHRVMRSQEPVFSKPAIAKPDIIAIKKKITLPKIDLGKNTNASYISYYQIVREKIKRAAYQNYTGSETGEVTISFIITGDGYLNDLRLNEDKSTLSAYLKEIALKSVKDASPFPNFPKELDYPQLSFNLAITFEIE